MYVLVGVVALRSHVYVFVVWFRSLFTLDDLVIFDIVVSTVSVQCFHLVFVGYLLMGVSHGTSLSDEVIMRGFP